MDRIKFSRRSFLGMFGVGAGVLALGGLAKVTEFSPRTISRLKSIGLTPGHGFLSCGGGQLKALHRALSDPFMQMLGICLAGDSKTWGMLASGIAPIEPRFGSLADARNNGDSPTWANLLHKWMGAEFYNASMAIEEGWPGSPSGVAQFTYKKSVDLFPGTPQFEHSGSFARLSDNTAGLGAFWYLNMNASGSGPHSFSWEMTGNSFDVRFATAHDGADYRVYIDGVLQGQYKTLAANSGTSINYGNSRTHNFDFRKGAVVRIEAVENNKFCESLRIESIRINRELRFTNQGVIGVASRRYLTALLSEALRADDSFCLIQLGTNDRGMPSEDSNPASSSSLKINIGLILDSVISSGVAPIVMCANDVVDSSPPVYHYDMQEVRDVLASVARDRRIDFIDNFSVTHPMLRSGVDYLADGLHPNDLGHKIIFKNIRDSIAPPATSS